MLDIVSNNTESGIGHSTSTHCPSQPVSVHESGLPIHILEDLICRLLLESGISDIHALSSRAALSSRLIEEVLSVLRADGRLEVLAPETGSSALRYNLTDHGRRFAAEARQRSRYTGPAPISELHYQNLISQQQANGHSISREDMQAAYADLVINPDLLDRLGAALHSDKAIFIHGPAGTGKTYLCSRLIRLLSEPVHIPHAVLVGNSIVRILDHAIHTPIQAEAVQSPVYTDRTDPRLVLCKRPFISSGGELTMDMLEIRQDPATGQFVAPLHMKAIHGIYMIDDLGRQRMTTDELFNRWIVPMESGIDYLVLDSGARLELPFDVILIFSTNLSPRELDDPAFQRRIGHKIGFDYLLADEYARIWIQECRRHQLQVDESLIDFVINELHLEDKRPMLACHPRDLMDMALDYSRYTSGEKHLTRRGLQLAWKNHFAN